MTDTERTSPVATDELFRLLGDSRRRSVLRHLERRPGWITVDELGGVLAALESTGAASDRERALLVQSLRHVHLPKLVDADLVEFDAERNAVRRSHGSALRSSLDAANRAIAGIRRPRVDG